MINYTVQYTRQVKPYFCNCLCQTVFLTSLLFISLWISSPETNVMMSLSFITAHRDWLQSSHFQKLTRKWIILYIHYIQKNLAICNFRCIIMFHITWSIILFGSVIVFFLDLYCNAEHVPFSFFNQQFCSSKNISN